MALSVQQFIKLANYYNRTAILMSAICVQKGGIPIENYAGRMYAADVLEYIVEYAKRLRADGHIAIPADVARAIEKFNAQFERVKHLTTPTQKPIYEMTLEEFEKFMNI
ncbi:MAG: hypothetical protein J6W40_02950 [Alphaproteobacteria bacterium]|nr:hypothetical protein [Alphaproteobacteria bacterium]